ncbi:unnamed protein product [Rangifer tarandus platyrhynchus]|uniref:Uncharacterized protein n=1 Tax=Rangifer tarandus platyrhynchus TaxID=3082113 RepID=A0ABN8YEX4_RANTA|nr:unnamed protein product [Rangifer tarandus platyrhynchus]
MPDPPDLPLLKHLEERRVILLLQHGQRHRKLQQGGPTAGCVRFQGLPSTSTQPFCLSRAPRIAAAEKECETLHSLVQALDQKHTGPFLPWPSGSRITHVTARRQEWDLPVGSGGRAEPSTRDTRRLCVESTDQALLDVHRSRKRGKPGESEERMGNSANALQAHSAPASPEPQPQHPGGSSTGRSPVLGGQPVQRCLSSLDVNETLPSKVRSPAFPEDAEELQVAT